MEDIYRMQDERDRVANRLVELTAILNQQDGQLTDYERYLLLGQKDALGEYIHLLDRSIDFAISRTHRCGKDET